jgi:hypothetical protein
MSHHAITIRAAGPADSRTLELLARLTGRSAQLNGTVLLAERDGATLAAIGLTSGAVLADPANTTLDVFRALRLARYQLMRQGGHTGAPRSLLSRRGSGFAVSLSRA